MRTSFEIFRLVKSEMLHVRSPVIKSTPLSKLQGKNVYLKLENVQPSATFKLRGIGHKIQKVK